MSEPKERVQGLRRKPIQKRGQASLDRLLDATEELLLQRRFDEIPISDIVEKANSSVGVFMPDSRIRLIFSSRSRSEKRNDRFNSRTIYFIPISGNPSPSMT